VVDLWLAYDDQYLMVEARPVEGSAVDPPLPLEEPPGALADAMGQFARSYGSVVQRWSARVREVADAGGRTVIWGSGSKGVAFLMALGTGATAVAAAVDINPFKHGRFLAGTGHPIVAPEELLDLAPDLVIAMNPAYLDEIRAELDRLGVGARLEAV
jgi:threonine dehydrogenase-like Zn-dependent dehydrogenase